MLHLWIWLVPPRYVGTFVICYKSDLITNSNTLLGLDEIAMTSFPKALANLIPMVPRPPMPMIPIVFLPLSAPQCFNGEYIVIPAQRIGAVCNWN